MLYSSKSAQDKGTLYAAKNFLNASNVPVDPMKDVNGATDFLWKYTDAMILSACLDTLQMKKFTDEPKFKLDDALCCLPACEKGDILLNEVVNKLILPDDISLDLGGEKFKCQVNVSRGNVPPFIKLY